MVTIDIELMEDQFNMFDGGSVALIPVTVCLVDATDKYNFPISSTKYSQHYLEGTRSAVAACHLAQATIDTAGAVLPATHADEGRRPPALWPRGRRFSTDHLGPIHYSFYRSSPVQSVQSDRQQ